MVSQHDRIRELFLEASEIASPEGRRQFIADACGSDKALRERLERMLDLETAAGAFFRPFEEDGPGQVKTVLMSPEQAAPSEGPGTVIGHYKLLEQIGEGGFGVVYMAEQVEPVKRRVALKIIKLGMDTREVIARFDAERQALALMDHPNVARVLDAGATASGRPYFVMELVKGLPITEFCDRHNLTTRERLELFKAVCHAAQHAHSKGVIHRDLKPSNILVTVQDGRPMPKVIDFGIAKAIQSPLTEKTLFTRFGQMIGTPVYMSPEHLSGADVDTRSDVYSLGVILYELLTGRQPFDLKKLREAGQVEMMRVIQEDDPPPPSTRLTTLGSELVEVAQHRSVNARRLSELIRGDLDWITMKALQKDRARRYETPIALAEDLERHLDHRPVTAGPPSLAYRSWKFVRRHHYAVAAAAGIVLALLAGLVFATYGLFKAREERERAIAAERAAQLQGQLAVLEAQRARAKELRARQISYASDMALASHALELSNVGRVLSLLNRHHDEKGAEDLRGWEWRYLWKQCQSSELFQLGTMSNSVLSFSVSADGGLAAAGTLDQAVAVWDLPARSLLWTSNSSMVMAMSPDGKIVIDGAGTLRDAASGRIVRRLVGEHAFRKLTFSQDGRLLAGTETRDRLSFWSAETWELLGSYSGFLCGSMHLRGLVFSTDAAWVAVGGEEGQIQLVEVRTGRVLRGWKGHPGLVTALALSPDSRLLASGGGYFDEEVKLWNPANGASEGSLKGHRAWVTSLAFSPDGSLLASGSADQSICLWDVRTRQLITRLRGHLHEVWCVAFLPDGKSLVSAAKDGSVKVWRIPLQGAVPGGPVFEVRDVPIAMDFAFTPDGRELLGADKDGWVNRWELPSMRALGRIEALSSNNSHVASCPKLGLVAALDSENTLRVWDINQQALTFRSALCQQPSRIAWIGFAPRGACLVSMAEANLVQRWEVGTWKQTASWSPGARHLGPVSISPNGEYLASGGGDLTVYALSNGCIVARIPAHNFTTDAVAFSPDGALLATASQDGLAKLWRTSSWTESCTLKGHLLGVHSLAFSPDGRRLATGSLGTEGVKLWDLTTMQEVLNLAAPGDMTWWLGFSPEGRTLIGYGTSTGLRYWSAPLLEEIQER